MIAWQVFSNYGRAVSVTAPGAFVVSTVPGEGMRQHGELLSAHRWLRRDRAGRLGLVREDVRFLNSYQYG
jgi:hypothetical protein